MQKSQLFIIFLFIATPPKVLGQVQKRRNHGPPRRRPSKHRLSGEFDIVSAWKGVTQKVKSSELTVPPSSDFLSDSMTLMEDKPLTPSGSSNTLSIQGSGEQSRATPPLMTKKVARKSPPPESTISPLADPDPNRPPLKPRQPVSASKDYSITPRKLRQPNELPRRQSLKSKFSDSQLSSRTSDMKPLEKKQSASTSALTEDSLTTTSENPKKVINSSSDLSSNFSTSDLTISTSDSLPLLDMPNDKSDLSDRDSPPSSPPPRPPKDQPNDDDSVPRRQPMNTPELKQVGDEIIV